MKGERISTAERERITSFIFAPHVKDGMLEGGRDGNGNPIPNSSWGIPLLDNANGGNLVSMGIETGKTLSPPKTQEKGKQLKPYHFE